MEYALEAARMHTGTFARSAGIAARKTLEHLHDHVIPHPRNNYRPHLLSHRALSLLAIFLIILKVVSISAVVMLPATGVQAAALNSENIISLTNESRAGNGLTGLQENTLLRQAAQAKADHMAAHSYFAHTSPDGTRPWDFIKATGYKYVTAGENLAVHFNEAGAVNQAWMNSPGHRANILNTNFTQIGIGISHGAYEGVETTFVVQMFGTPVPNAVTLQPAPTPIAQPSTASPPTAAPAVKSAAAASPAAPSVTTVAQVPSPVATPTDPVTPALVPFAFSAHEVSVSNGNVMIKVATSLPATIVLARYGARAIMLAPQPDGSWQGRVALEKLVPHQVSLVLVAYNMAGTAITHSLGSFSGEALGSPQSFTQLKPLSVEAFGYSVNPQVMENKLYPIIIVVLLTGLLLAIGIRRHVLHVGMVANAAFVTILATGLWWSGF